MYLFLWLFIADENLMFVIYLYFVSWEEKYDWYKFYATRLHSWNVTDSSFLQSLSNLHHSFYLYDVILKLLLILALNSVSIVRVILIQCKI
jgi:hypothetical protein